jgi:hypothetical protein
VIGDESQNAYRGAETGHLAEETKEMPGKTQSEEGLQGAQKKNLESETSERDQMASMGPTLLLGHAHAVSEALKAGRDPSTDPMVQAYVQQIQEIQKQPVQSPVADLQRQLIQAENSGDTATAQRIKHQLSEVETKPAQIHVETPGESLSAKKQALTTFQPAMDSAERFNVMSDSYEKAVKNGDQQAMLNLLANHLGMTMGLQKGARINRDLYKEAAQSTPWLQKIGAKFDDQGYLSGVTLNKQQMQQMVNLAQLRYAEDTKKARSEAAYLGIKDDGPKRTPGEATIRYYKALAGGNGATAKELAAADGWSVQ